jgi:hypothetical protein
MAKMSESEWKAFLVEKPRKTEDPKMLVRVTPRHVAAQKAIAG